MQLIQQLKQKVLNLQAKDFDDLALEIFRFQAEHNLVYQQYLQHLHIQTDTIKTIEQIPFLPIEFFKIMKQIFIGIMQNIVPQPSRVPRKFKLFMN